MAPGTPSVRSSCGLSVAACQSRAATSVDTLRPISTARVLLQGGEDPPPDSAAWSSVSLPDDWSVRRPHASGDAWYHLEFDAAAQPGPLGIYVPRLSMVGRPVVNGVRVADGGRFAEPLTRLWYRPQLYYVPSVVLQPGRNSLHIRLRTYPDNQGGLSEVFVGSLERVEPLWRRHVQRQVTAMQATTGITLALGVLVLGAWVSLLLHDSNFSDLAVCTFWLPAGASLATYTIGTHTTQPWTNATVSIYAASANPAGNTTGYYLVDDVSLSFVPANPFDRTVCGDPTAPTPPGGSDGPELLQNGDFGTGALAPGWTTFGQITQNVTGGVFQFYRPSGTPAGVLLQPTSQPATPGEILTASFQLGNSSFVRVRVTVILHDSDFSDLAACTFWLPAGQALSSYTMRTFTTKPWTNATLSVYPSTVGNVFWTQLDNVSFRRTPGATGGTVACGEPGAVLDSPR